MDDVFPFFFLHVQRNCKFSILHCYSRNLLIVVGRLVYVQDFGFMHEQRLQKPCSFPFS
ncbi:unnamed protein product [Ixodes pacificus]